MGNKNSTNNEEVSTDLTYEEDNKLAYGSVIFHQTLSRVNFKSQMNNNVTFICYSDKDESNYIIITWGDKIVEFVNYQEVKTYTIEERKYLFPISFNSYL